MLDLRATKKQLSIAGVFKEQWWTDKVNSLIDEMKSWRNGTNS